MPSFKEVLTPKITTKDAYDAALLTVSDRNGRYIGKPAPIGPNGKATGRATAYPNPRVLHDENGNRICDYGSGGPYEGRISLGAWSPVENHQDNLHHTRWWLHREWMRMLTRVYLIPDALRIMVERFPELAIHTRQGEGDEALAVYYTPDAQAGERDAQVRTTLGRLARKFYPQIADDALRDFEAAFRAEVLAEVEFIPPEGIASAYEGAATASCMSKDRSNWKINGPDYVHPADAYNAPGFTLAVSRNSAGQMSGRALCWRNPDNPDDKRMVRLYGDSALGNRLQRKGFRPAGLAGARLRLIPARTIGTEKLGDDAVLMPYVDSVATECAAQHGVRDGDWVRVVPSDGTYKMNVVRRAKGLASPVSLGVTRGYVTLPAGDVSTTPNCVLSGAPLDGTDMHLVWFNGQIEGVTNAAFTEATDARTLIARSAVTYFHGPSDGARINAEVTGYEPDTNVFRYDGTNFIDNTDSREACGFRRLDASVYGQDVWERSELTVATEDGKYYRRQDAEEIVTLDSHGEVQLTFLHGSQRALKYPNAERIHRRDTDVVLWCNPDVPKLTTPSGKVVVQGIHAIRQRYDGEWDFTRNLVVHDWMSVSKYATRGQAITTEDRIKFYGPDVTEKMLRCVRDHGQYLMRYNQPSQEIIASSWHHLGRMLVDFSLRLPVSADEQGVIEYATLPYYEEADPTSTKSVLERVEAFLASDAAKSPDKLTQSRIDIARALLPPVMAEARSFELTVTSRIADEQARAAASLAQPPKKATRIAATAVQFTYTSVA